MHRREIVDALSSTDLFAGLTARELDPVAEVVRPWEIPAGQHVFFEGDIATEFFVLTSGRIRVYVPAHGDELDVATVRPVRIFGEGGTLDGGPRAASALAVEPSILLAIPRDDWLRVLAEVPALNRRLMVALGASFRRYVSHLVDALFLDVDIPDFPPDEAVPT